MKKLQNKLVHGGDIYGYAGEVLDFSANINPLGLPLGVKQALITNIEAYTAYPDPLCRELGQALSCHHGLPIEQIVCGNGAADLIFRLVLAKKPGNALVLAPTFSEYEAALGLVDCKVQHHFLLSQQDFVLTPQSLEELLAKITLGLDMLFLCNPNNPTGIPLTKEVVLQIAAKCKQTKTLLVVDECFNDFLTRASAYSVVEALNTNPHLVVLKAFTKFYAMAGLRLGYALGGDPLLIEEIRRTLQPWSVSTPAAKCGVAALGAKDFAQATKAFITANRQALRENLIALGLRVYPSQANYVFFWADCKDLAERLQQKGILIRSCENYLGLTPGYYRVAVKNQEDNQRLIQGLKTVLEA